MSLNKPAFLYIMDPLCGWCYGFSNVAQAVQEQHGTDFNFKVIPGGMITGARVAPVSEMAGYILNAYQRVEAYTGVQFGEPYLDLLRAGTEISNSEPGCRAIHTAAQLAPEKAMDYTHRLQEAIFRDGRSWNEEQTFSEVAAACGLDARAFAAAWNSDAMRYGVQQDFQWVQAAGITGFPCCVVQQEGQYYLAAQGYRPKEEVEAVLEKIRAAS